MIILKMAIADNVVNALKKEADSRGGMSITKMGYVLIKESLKINEEVETS